MVFILKSQHCLKEEQKNIIINDFTVQFVLEKIFANEQIEKQQSIIDNLESFEAKDITNGNAFMSNIIRLSFRWKSLNGFGNNLPSSIIMKVPSPQNVNSNEENTKDDGVKETSEFLIIAHTRETRFYEHFPLLEPKAKLPKYYFGAPYHPTHKEGLILMEDMSIRATSIPVLPGFSEPQLFALLEEVAKIHSASWRFPQWEQLIGTQPIRQGFLDEMVKNAFKLIELEPSIFKPLIDSLSPCFNISACEQSNYSGSKFGFPACLVHADLWTPNVLWEKDEINKLCAIIDFQTVHSGNPCEDICRILSLNTSGTYRRQVFFFNFYPIIIFQNTERLLTFYSNKVAEFMNGNPPFTLLQLKEAYKHSMPFSALYLCFGIVFYLEMDSIVGVDVNKRKLNQKELVERCRMFLEDTVLSI